MTEAAAIAHGTHADDCFSSQDRQMPKVNGAISAVIVRDPASAFPTLRAVNRVGDGDENRVSVRIFN